MDPNIALFTLRALAAKILADFEESAKCPKRRVDPHAAHAFAERFEALDEWLSGGASMPEAWARKHWS